MSADDAEELETNVDERPTKDAAKQAERLSASRMVFTVSDSSPAQPGRLETTMSVGDG